MNYTNFDYGVHEHVARITIDRPKAYNALDLDSMKELFDIVNRCGSDRSGNSDRRVPSRRSRMRMRPLANDSA